MPGIQLFFNNAETVLAAALSPTDVNISILPASGFPILSAGQYYVVTLSDSAESIFEIVKVTAYDGDELFVVERAQEGTTALAWPAGTKFEARVTGGTLGNFAQGFDNAGDARGLYAINLQTSRGAPEDIASGDGAIVIGYENRASGVDSIAIGRDARADGNENLAIGAIKNRVDYASMSGHFPMIKMDDWDDNGEQYSNAPETVLCSPYFDLGVPPAWAASTIYDHGSIVQPTAPNGLQYRLVAPDDPVQLTTKLTVTSGGTEPVWPTVVGQSVVDGDGYWVSQSVNDYAMQPPPPGSVFVPTLFGFLGHSTFAPFDMDDPVIFISSNNTDYVISGVMAFTGPDQFSIFVPSANVALLAGDQFHFSVTSTPTNTAGRCVGRFFVRGFFVELPDHL